MIISLRNTTPDSQPLSQNPDSKTALPSQHWVVTDNETARRVKYIFRPNGDILTTDLSTRQVGKSE